MCNSTDNEKNCKGCALLNNPISARGGIVVNLDEHWALNHYDGTEGFLGWLALQPKRHVMDLPELNSDELTALGEHIKQITLAA